MKNAPRMDAANKRINCLVVDDEPLAREILRRYISRVPTLRQAGECENAIQAMTFLQGHEVDLLFLDIQMPELLGTEFVRVLQHPPRVIFTTAYAEYALEGFDLDVIDYLLKPIQFERFLKAIDKFVYHAGIVSGVPAATSSPESAPAHKRDPYLYFRTDRKMVKVMLDDIIYIEGMKNYVKIFTAKGTVITKHSMAAIEAMLPDEGFIRTHRSYIVSKARINSFTGECIGIGTLELPIGKLFKNAVMQSLDRRNPS